jgi:hypothetical protein
MKIKFSNIILGLVAISFGITGCQKGDLLSNPNVAAESSTVPASLLLNHITANLMKEEDPIVANVYKYNQNLVSNYTYYFGTNAYNWSTTNTTYDNIKYCLKMEDQAFNQYKNKTNVYFALSKFFKAYSYIWLTQRVGDIPMSQSNDINNLEPKYDSQHDVYKQSLALLDSANTQIAALISSANAGTKVDASGDVFGLTFAQWQKAINTYRLRVLISLSKRADDNADLNIKSQFAAILNNPAQYPIMTSNSDNITYKYNSAYNQYPPQKLGYAQYNNCANISKTWLNATVPNKDPRVIALLSPGEANITTANPVGSFATYVGEDNGKSISAMSSFTADKVAACLNYNRYMTPSNIGGTLSESYILVGYSEMCFNIAEAANRGWVSSQSAATWYAKGVQASLDWYAITQGKTVTIGNNDGTKPALGTTTLDVNTFLANIAYAGDNATGLTQILTQKYVSFFINSGFEAFYNWRRTGVPTFLEGGTGVGTPTFKIPLRWQYPVDETTYNATNNKAALTSQYGGSDDLYGKMWLIK